MEYEAKPEKVLIYREKHYGERQRERERGREREREREKERVFISCCLIFRDQPITKSHLRDIQVQTSPSQTPNQKVLKKTLFRAGQYKQTDSPSRMTHVYKAIKLGVAENVEVISLSILLERERESKQYKATVDLCKQYIDVYTNTKESANQLIMAENETHCAICIRLCTTYHRRTTNKEKMQASKFKIVLLVHNNKLFLTKQIYTCMIY